MKKKGKCGHKGKGKKKRTGGTIGAFWLAVATGVALTLAGCGATLRENIARVHRTAEEVEASGEPVIRDVCLALAKECVSQGKKTAAECKPFAVCTTWHSRFLDSTGLARSLASLSDAAAATGDEDRAKTILEKAKDALAYASGLLSKVLGLDGGDK